MERKDCVFFIHPVYFFLYFALDISIQILLGQICRRSCFPFATLVYASPCSYNNNLLYMIIYSLSVDANLDYFSRAEVKS